MKNISNGDVRLLREWRLQILRDFRKLFFDIVTVFGGYYETNRFKG